MSKASRQWPTQAVGHEATLQKEENVTNTIIVFSSEFSNKYFY
jgi:hypothetical protein